MTYTRLYVTTRSMEIPHKMLIFWGENIKFVLVITTSLYTLTILWILHVKCVSINDNVVFLWRQVQKYILDCFSLRISRRGTSNQQQYNSIIIYKGTDTFQEVGTTHTILYYFFSSTTNTNIKVFACIYEIQCITK